MVTADREPTPPIAPRPRLSRSNVCTQCRRMKQKCDRQTPCSNCIRRQIPQYCHLPSATSSRSRICRVRLPVSPSIPPPPRPSTNAVDANATAVDASRADTRPEASSPRPRTGLYNSSRIGQLWNSRGAPSYHGSSYFGHHSAASMMQVESPELPIGVNSVHASISRKALHRDDKRPYDHIWELVGYLPRRKAVVDHLVDMYFDELNLVHDCVHQETFRVTYDAFWNRKWGDDDLTAVDLRWLALLFMMLAFAELLNCPLDASAEAQKDCEETSVQFFWAARKAIVLSPTFSGESPDLVRSGILVSRYLIYFGRKTESWLTSSFAIRMAQAQGMHIDGESWGLPPRVLETRRRLWCKLYCLDRSISLAVGRPYTIHDKHCMEMNMRNIWLDDMSAEEAVEAQEQPLSDPTQNIYYLYQQRLSSILGDIHDECFGLTPLTTSYNSYEKVLRLDQVLTSWAASLPAYFRLEDADTSRDSARPFLYWQRMYLHSAYHFSRITLHRTYVLLESITDRFQYSRDACISSACADLQVKLSFRSLTMADRVKAGGAMHNLFNSALVLGILVVREPFSTKTMAIIEDLAAYCGKERADIWVNEFVLAEVKVIELCIASVKKARKDGVAYDRRRNDTISAASGSHDSDQMMNMNGNGGGSQPQDWTPTQTDELPSGPTDLAAGGMELQDENWLDNWFGPTRNFPEPIDYQLWEDLVGSLEAHQ